VKSPLAGTHDSDVRSRIGHCTTQHVVYVVAVRKLDGNAFCCSQCVRATIKKEYHWTVVIALDNRWQEKHE
jgi:hypothetical protein